MKVIYWAWFPEVPNRYKRFTKFQEAKKYTNKQKIECCINKIIIHKKQSNFEDFDTIYSNGKDK
jgi:hypothetical protein